MKVKYLAPGRPGESARAALHRKTDSPAQAGLRSSARVACLVALPFALVCGSTVIHDTLAIHGIRDTAHPEVHRAHGVVDVFKPSRRLPVFRLSRPGEPPLLFKCSRSVPASPRCPTPSPDWQARDMTVEWITMPTLLRAAASARATRMAAGDDVLFVAAPSAVQQAEVEELTASIQGAWRILGGLVAVCLALAGLLRARLWFLTRKIEAARLRARR